MFVGMALERVPSMIVCGLLDWYGLVWFGLRLEWFGLVWFGLEHQCMCGIFLCDIRTLENEVGQIQ